MSTQWALSQGFRCTNIVDQSGEEIGYVKDPEHAELIVRAVNAHAHLLAALKLAHRMLLQTDWRNEEGALADIQTAIAAAEGKE